MGFGNVKVRSHIILYAAIQVFELLSQIVFLKIPFCFFIDSGEYNANLPNYYPSKADPNGTLSHRMAGSRSEFILQM